jgi:hypothetical protein
MYPDRFSVANGFARYYGIEFALRLPGRAPPACADRFREEVNHAYGNEIPN